MKTLVLLGISATLASVVPAQNPDDPLVLHKMIPLEKVNGRIDHMAADVVGQRLFVAALGNNTVEVFDISANQRAKTVSGFGEPQGLAYVPEFNRLYVASAAGRIDILDAASLLPVKRIGRLDEIGRAHV